MTDSAEPRSNLARSLGESDPDITDRHGQQAVVEYGFTGLIWLLALLSTVGVLVWMSAIVFKDAQPAIEKFGLGFCGSKFGISTKRSLGRFRLCTEPWSVLC